MCLLVFSPNSSHCFDEVQTASNRPNERPKHMLRKLVGKVVRVGYGAATLGLKKGPHVTRYSMYNHLSKYFESRPKEHRVLSISHSEILGRLLGYADNQITDVVYPDINILNLPFEDEEFDAVVSDQVLEHVEGDPYAAIEETFRVLKRGGIALHTTCFINPIHGEPNDYWRFTPEALELLVSKHGEITDVGGWGNPYVWPFCALGLRFQPIPHARWHPGHWIATKNDNSWPIVTWALARKTAA